MPVWGRRGSYVAVTFVVSSLAVVGVVSRCNREMIPPPEPNELAGLDSPYMKRAGRHLVDWRTSDSSPFADARRLDRPVMVVVGTTVGHAARRLDRVVFAHPEVAARLNHDFVCVRIDATVEPEWRSAFLPILRDQIGSDPSYAIWFFRPNGELILWNTRRRWDDFPDHNDFLGLLGLVKQTMNETPADSWTDTEQEQRRELSEFRAGRSLAVPDVEGFVASLLRPRVFFQWQAGRYRVLLQSQRYDDLKTLLSRDLTSPRVDLVDGGLFRIGDWADAAQVEFDKVATTNAEMAALLARTHEATGDPLFLYWYERTMDALASQFLTGAQWSSYVESETGENARSLRSSFGVAEMRTQFDPETRAFAPVIGLDVATNPLMAPYLANPKEALEQRERLDHAVKKLGEIGDLTALTRAADDTLDSSGFVVARAIEAAAFLGDAARLNLALRWADELSRFRSGLDDVRHSTVGRGRGTRWLGDYVAYCDAMLEAFAATGNERYLDDGEAALRRALVLFTRDSPADIVATVRTSPLVTELGLEMPSLVDDGRPPALPWLMLICFRYGAVLGDKDLRERAVAVAERFAALANANPTSFATFFALAQEVMFTGCVVVPEGSGLVDAYRWFSSQPGVRAFPAAAANAEGEGSVLRYVKTTGSAVTSSGLGDD